MLSDSPLQAFRGCLCGMSGDLGLPMKNHLVFCANSVKPHRIAKKLSGLARSNVGKLMAC